MRLQAAVAEQQSVLVEQPRVGHSLMTGSLQEASFRERPAREFVEGTHS